MTNTSSPIVWINRGRENCKGNARSERLPDGRLHTTCDSCALSWYVDAR